MPRRRTRTPERWRALVEDAERRLHDLVAIQAWFALKAKLDPREMAALMPNLDTRRLPLAEATQRVTEEIAVGLIGGDRAGVLDRITHHTRECRLLINALCIYGYPLPPELSRFLRDALVSLETGETHPAVMPVAPQQRRRGQKIRYAREQKHLSAVFWLREMKRLRADPGEALKHIADCYGCDPSTIYKWRERLFERQQWLTLLEPDARLAPRSEQTAIALAEVKRIADRQGAHHEQVEKALKRRAFRRD